MMYLTIKDELARAAAFLVLAFLAMNGAAGAYIASMLFIFGVPSIQDLSTAPLSLSFVSLLIAVATSLIIVQGGRRLFVETIGRRGVKCSK